MKNTLKILLASSFITFGYASSIAQEGSKQPGINQEVTTPEMNAEREATFVWKKLTLNDMQRYKYKQAAIKRKYDIKSLKEKSGAKQISATDSKPIYDAFYATVTALFTPEQMNVWPDTKKELEQVHLSLD